MWTVYTYWNATELAQVLSAVVLVVGGSDMLGLLRSAALVALITSACVGLFKFSYKEPLQFMLALALFYGVMFVPRVTVTVNDVRTAGVINVANVPLGVAFIASVPSHIGHFLTEQFETMFAAADELRFSHTGLAWGAGALKGLAALRTKDPKTQEAFQVFTRACVVPEISDSAAKYQALVNSTNILQLLATDRGGPAGWLNPGRVATMPRRVGVGYDVLPCISLAMGSAFDEVIAWLAAERPNVQLQLARQLMPDEAPATANALIAAYLPGVEGALLGAARNVNEQILQAMSVSLMNDSAGSIALVQGDPAGVQLAVGAATATASSVSAYRMMGLIGAEVLPKFRNLIEVVIIGVFPLVVLIGILAGERAGGALRTYGLTAVWVQLWAPLYAIVNLSLTPVTAARFQASMSGATSQTMSNTVDMLGTGFSEQALAGSLVMAVPIIAYALVRGGEVAMGSAMSSLSASASAGAQTQGAAAGLGNISMGNTSWGNHSGNNVAMNKWDDNGSMSQGRWSSSNDLVGGSYGMSAGGSALNASSTLSNLGQYGARVSGAMAQSAQAAYSTASAKMAEASNAFQQHSAMAWGHYAKQSASSGTSSSVTSRSGFGNEGSTSAAASRGQSRLAEFATSNGLTMEQAWTAARQASAGLGLPTSLPISATVGGSTGQSASERRASILQQAQRLGQSEDFKALDQAVSKANSSLESSRGGDARSGVEGGKSNSYEAGVQALDGYRAAQSNMQQAMSTLSAVKSMDQSAQRDLANAVVAHLDQNHSGGAEAALRTNNTQAIEGAIQAVAGGALKGFMGGAYDSGQSGGPANPGGAAAAQLIEGATAAAHDAQVKADGAGAAVTAAQAAHAGSIPSPRASADLNGVSDTDVAGVAAGLIGGYFSAAGDGAALDAAHKNAAAVHSRAKSADWNVPDMPTNMNIQPEGWKHVESENAHP